MYIQLAHYNLLSLQTSARPSLLLDWEMANYSYYIEFSGAYENTDLATHWIEQHNI